MTPQEAIEVLKNDIEICTFKQNDACEMAIKALETVSCIKEKCAYCPHCGNCDVDDETLEIKSLESQSWISVSERLPEDYIHVLCQFTLGGMGECYLAHGVFHVVGGLVMTCNEVIAWLPLPEPYKEVNADEK